MNEDIKVNLEGQKVERTPVIIPQQMIYRTADPPMGLVFFILFIMLIGASAVGNVLAHWIVGWL